MRAMDAKELNDHLVDYLYGELDEEQRQAFEEGLRSHPELASELEGLERTRSTFADMQQLEPPAALTEALIKTAADRAPGRQKPDLLARLRQALRLMVVHPAVAAAAMLVLVVGASLYVYKRTAPSREIEPRGVVGDEAVTRPPAAPLAEVAPSGTQTAAGASRPLAARAGGKSGAEEQAPAERDEAGRGGSGYKGKLAEKAKNVRERKKVGAFRRPDLKSLSVANDSMDKLVGESPARRPKKKTALRGARKRRAVGGPNAEDRRLAKDFDRENETRGKLQKRLESVDRQQQVEAAEPAQRAQAPTDDMLDSPDTRQRATRAAPRTGTGGQRFVGQARAVDKATGRSASASEGDQSARAPMSQRRYAQPPPSKPEVQGWRRDRPGAGNQAQRARPAPLAPAASPAPQKEGRSEVPSAAERRKQAEQWLQRAMAAAKKKDCARALSFYQNAVSADPSVATIVERRLGPCELLLAKKRGSYRLLGQRLEQVRRARARRTASEQSNSKAKSAPASKTETRQAK
jgi:hypothetical protein